MALCSIAMAAGVIGALVLVKRFIFHRRFGAPMAFAPCGAGGGGWGGHPRWGRRGGAPGQSFWLRGLFFQLDTTPGQEREIRAAIEDFQRTARDARGGLGDVRSDLSRAIVGESFDDAAAGEASSRADAMAARVKEALSAALKRVHAVLDARQRERLAEILAKGPRFRGRWGGPYRDAAR